MKSSSSDSGAVGGDFRSSDPSFADALNAARPRLGRLGSAFQHYDVTSSTNDIASRLAAGGDAEGAVVVADEQSSGRGRRGHDWFSPAGAGLYVSVVLSPGRARADRDRAFSLLTLAAGVALAEAIETATGLRVDLKWPNDLYIGRRKLGGILAEAVPLLGGRAADVVVGYGINVSTRAFPPALADRATSLETELGRIIDRVQVFVESVAALGRRYDDLLDGRYDDILDAWRARAPAAHGTRVTWITGITGITGTTVKSGSTVGIDDRGALLVQVDDTVERIVSAELEWACY